jgi:hypothetical protein
MNSSWRWDLDVNDTEASEAAHSNRTGAKG